jgi:hypothetical protein
MLEIVIQLHYIAPEKRRSPVMVAKALVQTRIDAAVKEQATIVLENMGLTVSDAVRILLTRANIKALRQRTGKIAIDELVSAKHEGHKY